MSLLCRFRMSNPSLVLVSLFLLFTLCTRSSTAAVQQAVGQLLNVTGTVEVQRARQPVKRASLLYQLQQGDLLRVRDGGSAEVVLFQNGARFSLSGSGTARVGLTDLKPGSGSAPKALQRLSPTLVKRMNTPARAVSPRFLGILVRDLGDPVLGPRNPSPNGAARGAPVTLRWSGPVEGEALRLQISDGKRSVHRVDLPSTAREYRVSPGILRPGEYYVWSVTAIQGGESGPRCRALLRLLPSTENRELEHMEQEAAAARASSPDNPAIPLLLAQLYERLALFDDARAAYQEVLRLRPEDPGVLAAVKRLSEGAAGG
jgi:hypothetical protein